MTVQAFIVGVVEAVHELMAQPLQPKQRPTGFVTPTEK
jgi:hypothetical protein